MRYPDGTPVKSGDLVWWNEGSCLGYVQTILESPANYEAWGLDEPGIMICNSHPFAPEDTGVFHPIDSFEDEEIGLLSGAELEDFHTALKEAMARSKAGFDRHRHAVQTRAEHGKLVEWIFLLLEDDKEIERIPIPASATPALIPPHTSV